MNDVQMSRFLESFRLVARALTDLAFEAKRANDIKERMGR